MTAEDQEHADQRIPILLDTRAAVRFISYEPALGPISFDVAHCGSCALCHGIHWIIAGAESGHGARPMNEDWVRDVRDRCRFHTDTAFFYKQRIDDGRKVELPELDGYVWAEVPRV